MKRALITGIAGQDGSYLAEYLVDLGYEVHGVVRQESLESATSHLLNLADVIERIHLHGSSLDSYHSVSSLLSDVRPDECYHLASESYVSQDLSSGPELVTSMFARTQGLISAIQQTAPACRLFFAGSSEMFGSATVSPQNEMTPMRPRSLYGIAKLAAYHLGREYRDRGLLHFSTGILYNHESSRRNVRFVTRKVTSAVARIYSGSKERLVLGNLNAVRDWGYAPDYVRAMHAMLQQDNPHDFVLGTGELRSVKELVETAFQCVGLDFNEFVCCDQKFFRPSEDIPLCADATQAVARLGFKKTKEFHDVIAEMVDDDILKLRK